MRSADSISPTPTLAELVRRGAAVCDPQGTEDGVSALLARLEDRDEPVTAIEDVEEQVAEAQGAIDPESEDPAVVMTAAVTTYLAHRRTEADRDREHLLRLAARAEFDGNPPEVVSRWLAGQGVPL